MLWEDINTCPGLKNHAMCMKLEAKLNVTKAGS